MYIFNIIYRQLYHLYYVTMIHYFFAHLKKSLNVSQDTLGASLCGYREKHGSIVGHLFFFAASAAISHHIAFTAHPLEPPTPT